MEQNAGNTNKSSTRTRKRNGRWDAGTSGNPAGRPPGSRNKATLIIEQMLEGEAKHLTRKAIDLAKKGNIQALRLCIERLVPVAKERAVVFKMRPVKCPEDLPGAFQDVSSSLGNGEITPAEAQSIASTLMDQIRIAEFLEHDRRIQELEAQESKVEAFQKKFDEFVNQFDWRKPL